MRVLLVIGSQVNGFPPVRNLLEILLRNGHTVTLVARDKTGLVLDQNENFSLSRYRNMRILMQYRGILKRPDLCEIL